MEATRPEAGDKTADLPAPSSRSDVPNVWEGGAEAVTPRPGPGPQRCRQVPGPRPLHEGAGLRARRTSQRTNRNASSPCVYPIGAGSRAAPGSLTNGKIRGRRGRAGGSRCRPSPLCARAARGVGRAGPGAARWAQGPGGVRPRRRPKWSRPGRPLAPRPGSPELSEPRDVRLGGGGRAAEPPTPRSR